MNYSNACCSEQPNSDLTNADCIRMMTDAELANYLREMAVSPSCTGKCHNDFDLFGELRTFCQDCWLDWLRRRVDHESD
jgi:hypothetical protein